MILYPTSSTNFTKATSSGELA